MLTIQELREALRAREAYSGDPDTVLLHLQRRLQVGRRRHRYIKPTIASAVIVGIAVLAAWFSSGIGPGNSHHIAPGASATPGSRSTSSEAPSAYGRPAGYVGFSWRLTSVTHDGKRVVLPSSLRAYIAFYADGEFLSFDTINSNYGQFVPDGEGYRTHNVSNSLIGYSGDNAVVKVTMVAIGWISNPSTHVIAHLARNVLQLSGGPYELTCVRMAKLSTASIPPSSGH